MSECVINIREIVKEEVDKYLEEVGFKKSIGFKDDEIFLLSKEEYEKYKDVIPKVNCCWWLRSPGHYSDSAASVNYVGFVDYYGDCVDYDNDAVRPAAKIPNINISNLKIGDRFIMSNFPWIVIDTDLAIAEVPIAFDKFENLKISAFHYCHFQQCQ